MIPFGGRLERSHGMFLSDAIGQVSAAEESVPARVSAARTAITQIDGFLRWR